MISEAIKTFLDSFICMKWIRVKCIKVCSKPWRVFFVWCHVSFFLKIKILNKSWRHIWMNSMKIIQKLREMIMTAWQLSLLTIKLFHIWEELYKSNSNNKREYELEMIHWIKTLSVNFQELNEILWILSDCTKRKTFFINHSENFNFNTARRRYEFHKKDGRLETRDRSQHEEDRREECLLPTWVWAVAVYLYEIVTQF